METPSIKSHASIADSTVILKISFGLFGNTRKVPTSIIAGAEGTKLLKVQKTLLESEELKAIKSADTRLRLYLSSQCLPYEEGLMILPLGPDGAYLKKVHDVIVGFVSEREKLVDAFLDAYPNLVNESRANMEKLAVDLGVPIEEIWNPADYPPVETVAEVFTFGWNYISFSVPDELRVAGVYEAAKSNAENKLSKAAEDITIMMREAALDLVGHLKEALEPSADGKKKRLHATTVTNIQEFIQNFKDRNITNDHELEALVDEIGTVVHPGFDVDTLKKDEAFKSTFHSKLAGFTDQLTDLVEKVPGRKFKTFEEAA
jgi:hypothetical protein